MTTDFATSATPIGPFTALVDADGAVLASGWTDDAESLRQLIHPSLRPSELRGRADLGEVTRAVTAYHRGELTAIDVIEVRQQSGEFLMHAWEVLREIPAGDPVTYTEYAAISGRPDATRAAANACARNAAALFVPCHRVLRIGGALGGFRWGLPVKRWLLDHERSEAQLTIE
ncbi:methylated-DNA--[protein]-cysteine S-methyltransferase [Nocardia sp. CA-135953]|uniref:methylated-DNA--[protein]-cysteine S-methyltransferase n=1 Tax=Nocardia sp. CA-135953 TaxID=3239978 RepID=UPI003D958B50